MKTIRIQHAVVLSLGMFLGFLAPAAHAAQVAVTNIFPPTCVTMHIEGTITGEYISPLVLHYTNQKTSVLNHATLPVTKGAFSLNLDGFKPDSTNYDYTITDSSATQPALVSGMFTSSAPTGDCAPEPEAAFTVDAAVSAEDTFADVYLSLPDGKNAPELNLQVKYGTSASKLDKALTAMWNGTRYFVGLTPLKAKTTYYFRAYSANGAAVMKDVGTFTTKSALATNTNGIITALLVTNVRQTEALVKGTAGSTASLIEIWVDRTGNGTFDWKTPVQIGKDRNFSFPITNLKPGGTYHLVATKAGDPKTRYSNVIAFGTLPVAVAAYPSDLTSTTATITAEVPSGIEAPTLYYGRDSNSMTTKVQMYLDPVNLDRFLANVTGLTANTGYYYIVGSSDGKTFYMNPATFVTPAADTTKPPVVPTIQGQGGTSNLFWKGALVNCGLNGPLSDGTETNPDGTSIPKGKQSCGFPQLMQMISNIIDFILFFICPIIMTVLLFYHGLMILTSGGNSEKLGEAKSALTKAVVGFALACAAWIIVKFVLVTLGVDTTVFPVFY